MEFNYLNARIVAVPIFAMRMVKKAKLFKVIERQVVKSGWNDIDILAQKICIGTGQYYKTLCGYCSSV